MAQLVETDQHCPRSRTLHKDCGSRRSGAASEGACKCATRQRLEAKRRTARSNFRAGLGSSRHQRRTKTHANELWVAHASRASQTSYRAMLELKTEFD